MNTDIQDFYLGVSTIKDTKTSKEKANVDGFRCFGMDLVLILLCIITNSYDCFKYFG